MANLDQILHALNIPYQGTCPKGVAIAKVSDDSRQCDSQTLFVAIEGNKADGHQFLPQAARMGCPVALVSRGDITGREMGAMCLLRVENTRRALGMIAQYLAGDPSAHMAVVGITGTNGKTTISYLLESIFVAAGAPAGVIGTVEYRWPGHHEKAPQTTPSPVILADRLAKMRQDGVKAVAMEVSSHALDQHRVEGIRFVGGVFTNLTQDHLDYHQTMEAYEQAKTRLFEEVLAQPGQTVAVLNLDDPAGRRMAEKSRARRTMTYSLHDPQADLYVEKILFHHGSMVLDIEEKGAAPWRLKSPLRGFFNVQNCLAAAAVARGLGASNAAICKGIGAVECVPGRFEFVKAGQRFSIIVDYAHTPDALQKTMLIAKGVGDGRLITVMGCGGDRDAGKRPIMGRAAAHLSDTLIITNDNPRTEDPGLIAQAIQDGFKDDDTYWLESKVILDRRQAIRAALEDAEEGDVVLIAGKGHEDYQIIGGQTMPFDDRQQARELVAQLGLDV